MFLTFIKTDVTTARQSSLSLLFGVSCLEFLGCDLSPFCQPSPQLWSPYSTVFQKDPAFRYIAHQSVWRRLFYTALFSLSLCPSSFLLSSKIFKLKPSIYLCSFVCIHRARGSLKSKTRSQTIGDILKRRYSGNIKLF